MSDIKYTNHAHEQMIKRDISWPTIEAVAICGDVIADQGNGVRKMCAFGVVVVLDHNVVVTVYRDEKQKPKYQRSNKPKAREQFRPMFVRGRKVNVALTNHYLSMMAER